VTPSMLSMAICGSAARMNRSGSHCCRNGKAANRLRGHSLADGEAVEAHLLHVMLMLMLRRHR
jgi:hypothetical protein